MLFRSYQSNLDAEKAGKPYDGKLKEIGAGINSLWNQFRSHIRKEYPTQYHKLQAIDEAEVKELIQKTLKEMSATGAGAGAGHFEPGAGAQYATPFAFNPNKKAKGAANPNVIKSSGYKPLNEKNPGASLGPGPEATEKGVTNNYYVKNFKYKFMANYLIS